MASAYESTIYCERQKEILQEIMQEAVKQYLSVNTRVSLIEKDDQHITIKIPIKLKSW